MKTGTVKSRRHRQINVESELIRVLCGVDSLGIEALIENKALEYVLSVEIEARFVKPDVSHPEIDRKDGRFQAPINEARTEA